MRAYDRFRWWSRLVMLVALSAGLSLQAEVFLQALPVSPTGPLLCPGAVRVVIPFRTGPAVTHVTRVVFPQVVRPAVGGWNAPSVFVGITTDPDGDLAANSQRFRYTPPDAGASTATIVFDRPYWVYLSTFDQLGGAGLAANTDYFVVLDFSVDVTQGLHSGWCFAPAATDSANGAYTLTSNAGATIPAFTIEGVIHPSPPERIYTAELPGAGPSVDGVVAWGQRGDGVKWNGTGNHAAFSASGRVPYGGFGFPSSPPPWRALEAVVEGPGTLDFQFTGPVMARGGREPDFARCSLWIDRTLTQASIPAGGQTVTLGPGIHHVLWVPEMGSNAMHLAGNDFDATFTISGLFFGRHLTVADALDASETVWTPLGVWQPRGSSPTEDWVWSDLAFAATPIPCFRASVTGPGTLLFEGRLLVSYTDLQLWTHLLDTAWDSRFRISVDGAMVGEVANGAHEFKVPAGAHLLQLHAVTKVPSGAYPGNKGDFRAEIERLQYVPAQPATFAAWLQAEGLPPTTPPTDDADGNGVSAWMEWAAGVAGRPGRPGLTIEAGFNNVVLTAPRNRSALVDWRIEEMVSPGFWEDVTDQFSTDFPSEMTWRSRRLRESRAAAFYRLRALAR